MDRRKFIAIGTVGTLATTIPTSAGTVSIPTPKETEGPFYPIVAQSDTDFDLTQIEGRSGVAKGKHINIIGRVVDIAGKPIEGVTVDIWQANAEGRYQHPHDTNTAPVDDNFQGWGIISTNKEGVFKFKTIIPGAYPVSDDWSRPPHIHYKVTKKGYMELITQMYFPDEPLNEKDKLLQRKSKEEQQVMISKQSASKKDTFEYQIVLEQV
jgi:protocatechuate 3,4-dioxygenase beta subunit